jgi:hypothetical protein
MGSGQCILTGMYVRGYSLLFNQVYSWIFRSTILFPVFYIPDHVSPIPGPGDIH